MLRRKVGKVFHEFVHERSLMKDFTEISGQMEYITQQHYQLYQSLFIYNIFLLV